MSPVYVISVILLNKTAVLTEPAELGLEKKKKKKKDALSQWQHV